METFIIVLLVVLIFLLGAIFGFWIYHIANPCVGLLNVDDESDPSKTKWIFQLNPKISPEEITKKSFVRFVVQHNWR